MSRPPLSPRRLAYHLSIGLFALATIVALVVGGASWSRMCGEGLCPAHPAVVVFLFSFAAWPAVGAVAVRYHARALMLGLMGAYAALTFVFVFSAGGPHLTTSLPISVLAAALGLWGSTKKR